MTDLSASNDVISMIFQGYTEEKNSSFLYSLISFLHLFTFHQLQLYRQLIEFNVSKATAGTSKHLPPEDACRLNFLYIIAFGSRFVDVSSSAVLLVIAMIRTCSLVSLSTKSDIFYVERSSEEYSPARSNIPAVLNSMELSGTHGRVVITISSHPGSHKLWLLYQI